MAQDQPFQMRPRHFSRIAAPGQIPAPPAQSESKMQQVTEFFAPPHGLRRFWLSARRVLRFAVSATTLESLLAELKTARASLPGRRKGPFRDGQYTMADIGLSAFSVFFMGSPAFLGHRRALEATAGRTARPCSP